MILPPDTEILPNCEGLFPLGTQKVWVSLPRSIITCNQVMMLRDSYFIRVTPSLAWEEADKGQSTEYTRTNLETSSWTQIYNFDTDHQPEVPYKSRFMSIMDDQL